MNGEVAEADWACGLATAVVTRSTVAPGVRRGLRIAFSGVSEVVFVLASVESLECFSVLHNGESPDSVAPGGTIGNSLPSAALRAIQERGTVLVDSGSPDRSSLLDWKLLSADGSGIDWLLAVPLCCTRSTGGGTLSQLLGAVLVAGRGSQPSVDVQWLQEWACEMAHIICHVSVAVMESSLEVLGVLFPPRVLEKLVSNAASKNGQVDLKELLQEAAASTHSPASSRASTDMGPAQAPASGAHPSTLSTAQLPTTAASTAAAAAAAAATGPSSPRASPDAIAPPHASCSLQRSSMEGWAQASPFARVAADAAAAAAGRPPGSLPSSHPPTLPAKAAEGTAAGYRSPSPLGHSRNLPAAAAATAAQLLQQPSGGSNASSLLRQLSMHSHVSFLLDDTPDVPVSPHNWEVAGYEDLLEDDKRCSMSRRASMALERAQSRPMAATQSSKAGGAAAPTLEQSIAAAQAAIEEAGGFPKAAQEARVCQAAAAALQAAGEPSAGPAAASTVAGSSGVERAAADTPAAAAAGTPPAPDAATAEQQVPLYDAAAQQQRQQAASLAAGNAAQPLPPTPAVAASSAPPPYVRVPWMKKPLLRPLTSTADASSAQGQVDSGDAQELLLLSPRKPVSPDGTSSCASSLSSFASAEPPLLPASARSGASPSLSPNWRSLSGRPPRGPANLATRSLSSPPHAGGSIAVAAAAVHTPPAAKAGSVMPALDASHPSNEPGTPPPPPGAGAGAGVAAGPSGTQQQWDLTFKAPVLEAQYRRWLQPHLIRGDVSLGMLHWLVAAAAVAKLLLHGAAPSSLLSLAALLMIAAPALPALLSPVWWVAHRTAAVAIVRLLAMLLATIHLAVEGARQQQLSASPSAACHSRLGWVEAALAYTGAAPLLFLPLRFPVPFSLHMPLHLLCLWVLTAGASLAHLPGTAAGSGNLMPSLPGTLVVQLLVGFLLSSAVVYWREARLRASFLCSRRAAVCLSAGTQHRRKASLPAVTPA